VSEQGPPTLPTLPGLPAPTSEFVLWRLTQVESRVARIDEQGSRGMSALTLQVHQLARDLEDHEVLHKDQAAAAVTTRRWMIGTTVTAMLAFIGPLYVILLNKL